MEALHSVLSVLSMGASFFEGIQLSNDMDRLRAALPKARMLICRSEWAMFKDKQLAKLLWHLKDTTYDAEDLLRQLDDQALRQRIEDADRSRAGQLLSSSLNLVKTYIRGSKGRIYETRYKLDKVVAEIEKVLNRMGLIGAEPSQIMPETSSVLTTLEVVGRDGERNALIEMLGVMIGREAQRDQVIQLLGVPHTRGRKSAGSSGKRAATGIGVASASRAKRPKGNNVSAGHAEINCKSYISVIPIVGIAGVGKTTLAQYIYNDPRVKNHFDVRIWVCASDFFDMKRITKEIIESIRGEAFNTSCSLMALQVELMERLKMCPKILLVLDDVWPNAINHWEAFYAPLKHGPEGSMILVTTRYPVVATCVTTSNCEPFQLQGLPSDVFWDFFKKCAFGKNDLESYPHLQDIGHSISIRLCGSPLAAKTLGRLLNMSLTEQHWRTIQNSELWELRHEHNEILPALQLSYLYLPEEVKRCFLFCSMFPKGYSFERDEIVDIWVAEGFVAPWEGMSSEDVGISYLDELKNRFLFQTDPKFPNKTRYVMHDLIHDMAMSFSMDECFVMQDLSNWNNSRMLSTVRHMSIEVDGESLTKMGDIQHFNKLHSLRVRIGIDVEITWFNQLSNILYLSLKGCKLVKLPESICELTSLRYLDISHSCVQELPKKLWCLYSLQVLDASRSSLKTIHQDVTKLINLRQLALPVGASQALSRVRGLGNLSCLRNLKDFRVAKGNGRGIGELKFMNQLNGTLAIRSLANVGSEEDAAEARLVDKQRLKELVLQWRMLGTTRLMANENGVLERLCPHSRIECLRILGFGGDMFPSWFKPEDLPTLRGLDLSHCFFLESLSMPCFSDNTQAGLMGDGATQHASSSISRSNVIVSSAFTCLADLRVYDCLKLTSLEHLLIPEILPSIKSIVLEKCPSLASIPVHRFVEFDRLQDLKICGSYRLQCQREMVLPPSLRRLCIVGCNELDRSFPACLEKLTSLTLLQLAYCDSVKCALLNSSTLKCLVISECRELSSIGGLQGLAFIQHVQLSGCPNLTEVQLPFEKRELRTKEGKELLKFLYTGPSQGLLSNVLEVKSGHREGAPARPVGDAERSPEAEPAGDPQVGVCGPAFYGAEQYGKSGHQEGVPARPVGDAERSPEAEPAGDPQVGVCVDSIRRLFQQLVHVRTTISSFGGKLPSDAWFNHVKHLTSDAEESLEHLHYRIILANLGVGTHLKELVILPVTDKLEGLRHASPGLSGAVIGNYSNMLSLSSSVMRCILLCRGILGIINIVNTEGRKESLELPVFAFDDLTYAGQKKGTGMDTHSVLARMTDPIYLSPIFIRNLLCLDLSNCNSLTELPPSIGNFSNLVVLNLSHCYSLHILPVSVARLKNLQILVLSCCHKLRNLPVSLCVLSKLRLLDLAGCSSLENLPASLVTLGNLEILNLSYCKELKELPQPFGNLQELKYLNLSGSHRVNLDVECLCTLANLKSLTLSPLTNIQGFPDSFKDLANHLDSLRWWKKNQIHHQCGPKAASLHSYRYYEQRIIDMLLSDESDIGRDQTVTSACIVGESGMGKTELVHQIYNNRMILDTFDLRIWLYMCDKKRLLGKIVEVTTSAYCGDASVSVLEEIVIEELTSKRLLLVLDDSEIKSQYFWGYLRKLLNVCAKGSAVIITTKSKEVANQIGAMQTFFLSPLSKEECFMIFKEHVLEYLVMNNYCQLKSIGWKFVEKCDGNLMCIKALIGLFCHSEVGLSEIDMTVDGTLSALRLCYDLLPAHLQQCFKFCSLFPKGYIFVKHHIIRLWIAEGFVLCEEGIQPEDTAMHYFDELCCRSFFQRPPFHNDHKDNFVMHELFHDLAQSVSKNECFRCEEPFCSLAQNVSHLSLVLSDFKTAALSNEVRNLQSFLVVRRCFPVVRIFTLDDIFMKHRFLRTLNLSYTDIAELPISIRNMKHLRLLALNHTKIKNLPIEIGQVNSLHTLELNDCCHLIDLPGSISNLAKLRHLDVQKEPGNINVGMPRGIGHLTDLQTLTTFNIGNDMLHCSILELKSLNGLRGHVHVTGLENVKTANNAREANMMGKHLLEALTLEWSDHEEGMVDNMGNEITNEILQNLQPNRNIIDIVIRNYAGNLFPVWMQDNYLCKLISVTLDNCHGCSKLPYLGDLASLKYLFIKRINCVESFGIETSSLATEEKHPTGFPSLEVLNICEMYDLQFWVGTREEDFPRLFHLSVSRCPKLTNLPRLISLVHVSFHCGGELPTFAELPSLESLKIEGFQKIRSIGFPRHLTTLKKMEIIDCKELLSVYAYSLSVSDLKVARCLKLDLVGSSLEDHIGQKTVCGSNSLTRRHMVLKTLTYTNLLDDGSKWKKFGEKDVFGYKFARSYYTCIWKNSTGCSATKISQPHNNDPNTLFVMYISEHNHGFSNEPHLELSRQLGTGRKRKEYDASSDENTSKKQLQDSFV